MRPRQRTRPRPARHSTLAALLCAALSSGCTVDQRAEVERYRAVIDEGATPPEYRSGEPLSLRTAVALTRLQNEALSIEGEAYLRSLIERQRRASSLMPTLDAFGSLTFRDETSGGGGGDNDGGGSSSDGVLFDAGLGAQYTLFTGLSDFNRVRASELTIEQRRWLLLDLRETLMLDTARAYYAVLLAERLTRVIQSSLEVQEERLRDIRGRRSVGFARPLDVAQIEAQASATRVQLLDAKNQAANARSALALLTGAELSGTALSDEFAPPGDDLDVNSALELARARRQDLAAVAASANAARAEVDAALGRFYPSVTVNFDYFLTRDTIPSDRDWAGILTVNLPLFTAGRLEADLREAWSLFREEVLRYSLTFREVRRDVEVAIADLAATRARVTETVTQVRVAEEALRQAEASYQAGLGTNLERIVAQDQFLSAEISQSREQYSEKVAYLALMRAAGVLTEVIAGAVPPSADVLPRRAVPEAPFIVAPPSGSGGSTSAEPAASTVN